MLAPTQIQTPRLMLRALARDDAEALLAIHADAQVMQHANTEPWTGIDQAHALVRRSAEWLESGQHLCLGVTRLDTQQLLGTCTLYDIDPHNRRAEVGFVLGAFAWRQGFMAEALAAVVRHGFEGIGLNRVEADTDPRNARAIRLLERLGFQREGLLRQRWMTGGQASDSAFYGLLRDDWR